MSEIKKTSHFGILIKPTEKCLEWINKVSSSNEQLVLDDINFDCNFILLPNFNNQTELFDYLKENYLLIFKKELASWENDHTLWPQDLTYEHFLEMFDLEFTRSVFELK